MTNTCKDCRHHYYTDKQGGKHSDICRLMGGGDTVEYDDGYNYISLYKDTGPANRLCISEWVTVPDNFGCIHFSQR